MNAIIRRHSILLQPFYIISILLAFLANFDLAYIESLINTN